MAWKILQQAEEGGVCGIRARRDAEVDGELGDGVGLMEGGREAFVELGFKAFAGTDYGDVWDFAQR